MMDAHDTNLPLNQGELEEEKKTVEVSEAITETPTEEGTEKVTEEVTAEVQTEAACHKGRRTKPIERACARLGKRKQAGN
mgnify:CR=1 FL=1